MYKKLRRELINKIYKIFKYKVKCGNEIKPVVDL